MAGYTRFWTCRICTKRQETIDYPRTEICPECLEPLARVLCRQAMGRELDMPGVDVVYWRHKADEMAYILLHQQRWCPRGEYSE